MDNQLEHHLKEMSKDNFHSLLKKLEIDIKTTDTDDLEKEKRYELYKIELEQKFKEQDIAIKTVDDLKKLEEAQSLQAFKNEIAQHTVDIQSQVSAVQNQESAFALENFSTKTEKKSWLGRQIDAVMNKEEWKNNT